MAAPLMESLEPRLLLNGMTLITHGYGGVVDDWVAGMAVAVGDRAGGYDQASTWTLEVTDAGSPQVSDVNLDNGPNRWDVGFDGETIVKLDWSTVSTYIGPFGSTVSTVQVADAVLDYLLTTTVGGQTWLDDPIHLIGHSRGGSLVGAIAEGLGANGVAVDQVTFLDPHPTANGLGSGDDDWGETGMSVPANVGFADCYYREGGLLTPDGAPVTGALNFELNESWFAGDTRGYGGITDVHSDVHLWYHGTIPTELTLASGFDGEERATADWYVSEAILSGPFVSRETSGYNYSRIAQPEPASVVGRYLLLNNSALDGADPAANAGDDAAIAVDTIALMPGEAAGGVNLSGYSRGINGIIIDIDGLADPAALPAADFFEGRIGSIDPISCDTLAPDPVSVTVREGEGAGGSDRVTILWADGAIVNKWLEITVKAGAATGLASDDVFYFGSLAGDADGSGQVDLDDFVVLKTHFGGPLGGVGRGDYDVNNAVDLDDFVVLKQHFGASLAFASPAPPTGLDTTVDLLAAEPSPPQRRWARSRARVAAPPEAGPKWDSSLDLLAATGLTLPLG